MMKLEDMKEFAALTDEERTTAIRREELRLEAIEAYDQEWFKPDSWSRFLEPDCGCGDPYWTLDEDGQEGLNICFEQRDMNIILLSHVGDKTIVDPTVGEYHAFQMRSNKKVNSLIKDWVDFNLFADYDKSVNDGKPKSHGNRLLHTKYAMGFEAKSRLTLPNQLPLEWDSFYQAYVKALEPSTKEAA